MCSPGWLGIFYMPWAGLELMALPASTSNVLEFRHVPPCVVCLF